MRSWSFRPNPFFFLSNCLILKLFGPLYVEIVCSVHVGGSFKIFETVQHEVIIVN